MDLNRNHIFCAGLVFLLLGVEFFYVDALVLTPEATRILAEHTKHPMVQASNVADAAVGGKTQLPPHRLQIPEWLGWCFMSIGGVLVLHSLAMPKPSG
jgi:hypothetical protein